LLYTIWFALSAGLIPPPFLITIQYVFELIRDKYKGRKN